MEIGEVSKMIAHGFVSGLIKKKKVKKKDLLDGASDVETDTADLSFGEIEDYYRSVVSVIENTPEIRKSLVDALKNLREKGIDLNKFYPSQLVASEESLSDMIFMVDK